MKVKSEVKRGDIIHIYHIYGVEHAMQYRDEEGMALWIDFENNVIHGTWDAPDLRFDDDWEIID